MSRWPSVSFDEVLTQVSRVVPVEPATTYTFAGVRSFGGGCFVAGERSGDETRYQKLLKLAADDFMFPKLMAWEGAFAVVPETMEGTYVSPEFCTFRADPERLDIRYLAYYFRWPDAWASVAGNSPGTNVRRRRLYPETFLNQTFFLPPIDEQRHIASYLDETLGKLEVVAGRTRVLEPGSILALFPTLVERAFTKHGAEPVKLGELVDVVTDSVKPGEDPSPAEAFIGLQHVEMHTGRLLGFEDLGLERAEKRRFSPGDIVYGTLRPNLNKVWVADRSGLCSVDQRVLRPRQELDPELIADGMRSAPFLSQVLALVPGLQLPRIRLTKLLQLEIRRVDEAHAAATIDDIRASRARVAALVDLDRRRERLLAAATPSLLNAVFDGTP